jgi:hypothetical protein
VPAFRMILRFLIFRVKLSTFIIIDFINNFDSLGFPFWVV